MPKLSHLFVIAFVSTPALADVTETAPDSTPRYPRAVIARPLTLPARMAMFGADATSNRDLSVIGTAPIAGAGITDELEVQVPYAFTSREFEGKGALAVDVGYAIVRGALDGKLEIVARARAGYSFLDEAALPLALGVHAQYNATDWLAIISGVPGAQQLRIALEDDEMTRSIDGILPLGIGVQATGEMYVQLDTTLTRDTVLGALTAVYNVVGAVDVQAAIATDFDAVDDGLTFLVGARYYANR